MKTELREGLNELMRRLAEGRPRRGCLEALGDYRDLSTRESARSKTGPSEASARPTAKPATRPPPADTPQRLPGVAGADDHDLHNREVQKCALKTYDFRTTPLETSF